MSAGNEQYRVRVLFDETHSESWSISKEKARQISPQYPEYSSYAAAADLLSQREFSTHRNLDQPLIASTLKSADLLALIHPCDPRWERTVSGTSPRLLPEEIRDIQGFVEGGGGLLVVTEYEHEKYGDNLNDLLAAFGLAIENSTVMDRAHCICGNPAWVLGEATGSRRSRQLTAGSEHVCFYQSGSVVAQNECAQLILESSAEASPASAGLIASATYGKGRVIVVADSLLFGDSYLTSPDHQQLWLNLCYWLSAPVFQRFTPDKPVSLAANSVAWANLKAAVNQLRLTQAADGHALLEQHGTAHEACRRIIQELRALAPYFPHQIAYHSAVQSDLEDWAAIGFPKPDFSPSLAAYNPQRQRVHQSENLVLFPLYTPNASPETRFEALLLRVPWPDWLAQLERTVFHNSKFAPGHLVDFTSGYASECAVLFPETVSAAGRPTNPFATIFCDREARRLQAYALRSIEAVQLASPPAMDCLLNSLPMLEDTLALWDLIHDQAHSLGELPFDPFMIRQRAPFWMYGLEELRVDLRTFSEATKLVSGGFVFAHYVHFAILLDRIFRFPIVGRRVKNYDGLAGQMLFAFLHHRNVLIWSDNTLAVNWVALPAAMEDLRLEIASLYRHGATCSKLSFWIEAHDLVSKYVKPSVASRWRKESRAIDSEADLGKWIDLVEEDEFPLGNFHLNLKKRLGEVRWH